MKTKIITFKLRSKYHPLLLLAGLMSTLAQGAEPLPLAKLNMPEGFSISIYAEVPNPRQMAMGDDGVIYVGSLRAGKVHAVRDLDGDAKADQITLIAEGLSLPSGVAYRDGDLYVGAINEILVYRDIQKLLNKNLTEAPAVKEVLTAALPTDRHHGWKYLEFGPDGYLYIPVGAPCNICEPKAPYASIQRMKVDAGPALLEPFVEGVRNSVGFDWHPDTGELWFTDNGRDLLGDDSPPCELNRVSQSGQHFGYPFFHGHSLPDPEFSVGRSAADYVEPALALDPHVAPLGMMFYTGTLLPPRYHKQILIPEHGSWNRTPTAGHTGHRITVARIDEQGLMHYEVLVDGWLQDNVAWGRPADLLQLQDGSVLISDDTANVIYRLSYIQPQLAEYGAGSPH